MSESESSTAVEALSAREASQREALELISKSETAVLQKALTAEVTHTVTDAAVREKYLASVQYQRTLEQGHQRRVQADRAESERHAQRDSEEQPQGFTFSPQLSRPIRAEERRTVNDVADATSRWAQTRESKLQKLAAKAEKELLKDVTLAPRLSHVSELLAEAAAAEGRAPHNTPAGIDQRISDHRKKMEALMTKHMPSFKPQITPYPLPNRASDNSAADAADQTAAAAARLYEEAKAVEQRRLEALRAAVPQTNCPKRTDAQIHEHIANLTMRAGESERRRQFRADRVARETTQLENNNHCPVLNPNTEILAEGYRMRAPLRQAQKEAEAAAREAAKLAEAQRSNVARTAPERSQEFLMRCEMTLQHRAQTVQELAAEREAQFEEEHPFRPALCNRSRAMAEQLYEQAEYAPFLAPTTAQIVRQQCAEATLEELYEQQQRDLAASGRRRKRFLITGSDSKHRNVSPSRRSGSHRSPDGALHHQQRPVSAATYADPRSPSQRSDATSLLLLSSSQQRAAQLLRQVQEEGSAGGVISTPAGGRDPHLPSDDEDVNDEDTHQQPQGPAVDGYGTPRDPRRPSGASTPSPAALASPTTAATAAHTATSPHPKMISIPTHQHQPQYRDDEGVPVSGRLPIAPRNDSLNSTVNRNYNQNAGPTLLNSSSNGGNGGGVIETKSIEAQSMLERWRQLEAATAAAARE